jgi:hypothetical protein
MLTGRVVALAATLSLAAPATAAACRPTPSYLRAKHVMARHVDEIMAIPGIYGMAIGGKPTALVFSVMGKKSALAKVPDALEGICVRKQVGDMPVAL